MTVLATWIDEIAEFANAVPGPKLGGTWLYCSYEERDPGGVIWCRFRTRRWKTYRRHWRRHHREQQL